MPGDLGMMELGNLFVLGRQSGEESLPLVCQAAVSAVFFSSRRWGMGDERVDEMTALPIPVAYFDPSVVRNRLAGPNLLLPAAASIATVVSGVLQWWLGPLRNADELQSSPAQADRIMRNI
jgi:hypothetical protein